MGFSSQILGYSIAVTSELQNHPTNCSMIQSDTDAETHLCSRNADVGSLGMDGSEVEERIH